MLSSILRRLSSLLFCLLFANSVYAFDSSQAFNTVTFSYIDNASISQIIVLNDSQRSSATSLTLSVDAKDGGGRPTHYLDGSPATYSTQYDVAIVQVTAYNSSGVAIGTVQVSQNLKNWGSSTSNPGWSTGPGDNQHPWSTVSATLTDASVTGGLAAVSYVKVSLISQEGSYWAGNYGVQYRTPTLQVDGTGSNLLYNSEFGVDSNGVKVQGWTPSYNTYSSCGVTSGNAICATQESTVTANMWGGGEDPNGGTTSGQAGGYDSTITTDNADTAAETGSTGGSTTPPAPTPVYSSSITAAQSARRAANLPSTGMEAHISIDGHSNLVSITQAGDAHYLELGIVGISNNITIEQANTGSAKHYLETNVVGSNNNLDILQEGTGAKTAFVTVDGNDNTAQVIQRDAGQHYLQLDLIGTGHDATIVQEGSGNHAATVELTNGGGAWTFDLTQSGSTNKEYSLPHAMSDGSTTSGTCYVAAGCSLSVIQND